MKKHLLYKRYRLVAIVLLVIVALNGIAAGYSFITDPSGVGLGITLDYLRADAPFDNYLIPGIILFSIIGVWGLFTAVLAIIKSTHYAFFVLLQGCILVGWISVQLMMVTTFHPLHLIIGLSGFSLIALGWLLNKKQLI